MGATPQQTTARCRSPDTVMRLARLGSFHQCRLSFMRTLLRRLREEHWQFDRPLWEIDDRGVGRAVYRAKGPRHCYSLVAFSHDLDPALRSDRVIATAWDATFALFDGEPDDADLERLAANVPKQEAGRISDRELSLSRANRSVRLWEHVLERLAEGRQPDAQQVTAVGYLMRTTAVYGCGKFGAADREKYIDRILMRGPFRIEMLSVYLTRAFTLDLVEHLARLRGGERATVIEPRLRRRFGVGNSTGLGMAPFLINHPALLDAWIQARETALARVRAIDKVSPEQLQAFRKSLQQARLNVRQWRTEHPIQIEKIDALRADLATIDAWLEAHPAWPGIRPWDYLYQWAEGALSLEGQEQLVSLMLEPHGDQVDALADHMDADEAAEFAIDGTMRIGELNAILQNHYAWVTQTDYSAPQSMARFWYVSEEKLEPRLGERYREPGAEYEQPLAVGRDAAAVIDALAQWAADTRVADFLLACPQHRHILRRVQMTARHPYAEIRDNLIDQQLLPIDLLRCKLSFFGATRFDPRSDRWIRICMYQGAPFPHELQDLAEDDWSLPALEPAP